MVDVANVTNGKPAAEVPNESAVTAEADAPQAVEQPVAPGVAPNPSPRRVWSMPNVPVDRTHADKLGRIALEVVRNIARFVAGVARYGARVVTQACRAIDAVPRALQLFFVAGLLMLLGLVGAIALRNSLGLICTIVVVPVCAITLGALGHRWYSGLGNQRPLQADTPADESATSDLQRAVEYVDRKLAVALTSFGTERHQQAVIALFQAKTAVELTLGTERDIASDVDVPLPADEQNLRPRIRVGSASKSLLRESPTLAAS